MRKCTVCKETKSEEDYYYRDKSIGRLHAQCKLCYATKRRVSWNEYYYKHGSKYRENALLRNRKLKEKLRLKLLEYLSDKACVDCGNNDPRVLEFDHIKPDTKSFGISKAIHDIVSWDKILAEMDKCQILCANCHKIKTAHENGWYKARSLI